MPGQRSGMAGASSQAASVGGLALGASRGAHPTMRLDSFLKSTDPGYQHAEAPTQGDRFIRKMATYGQIRPSVSFVSEARAIRPVKECGAMDMSILPHPLMDPKGDPREGTFEIPPPPAEVDDSFIKMYQNHSLMLPSERYKEHLLMKAGEQKWREERDAVFRYRKRMTVLERKHPEGILGVDGPTHPDTLLYKDRYQHLAAQAERKANIAENRFGNLHAQNYSDDAVAMRSYGTDPGLERSKDICIQRKCIDPEQHPFRFLDTHARLFPKYSPTWDPERAAALRSHDVRDRQHNIINGARNELTYDVALPWEEVQQQAVQRRVAEAAKTATRSMSSHEI
ncbi:hypothetical protein AK812_SmicGene39917 [Symbiodinium microadriaticum]|uniref:Uncharacterized protein n=1 Tax=Symbiodinium microadriaticum TaxID=2951 RepID=A0A1Q9C9Z9_SYMMI|nr:hypothetical protein AK812_SmicGene39917 [Symbiodinium microadriaticum]CAE7194958.1 unnamed protein product [Symbiodinium microadriaticum]